MSVPWGWACLELRSGLSVEHDWRAWTDRRGGPTACGLRYGTGCATGRHGQLPIEAVPSRPTLDIPGQRARRRYPVRGRKAQGGRARACRRAWRQPRPCVGGGARRLTHDLDGLQVSWRCPRRLASRLDAARCGITCLRARHSGAAFGGGMVGHRASECGHPASAQPCG